MRSRNAADDRVADDAARRARAGAARQRKPFLWAALAAVLAVAVGTGAVLALERDEDSRQELVAERGERVMPFDLDRTTHVFRADRRGGIQRVLADDPGDRRNVRLIRAHLEKEAAAFRRGDFGDPAAIHGQEMPGLSALREGHRRISVRYRDLLAGGQLAYRTGDRELVRALDAWFDAQLSDHGADATGGGHSDHSAGDRETP